MQTTSGNIYVCEDCGGGKGKKGCRTCGGAGSVRGCATCGFAPCLTPKICGKCLMDQTMKMDPVTGRTIEVACNATIGYDGRTCGLPATHRHERDGVLHMACFDHACSLCEPLPKTNAVVEVGS